MSKSRTILLVDDVELFRDVGSLFLAPSGRVITASSGEEAIEVAQRERPDVMIVDLLMPGLAGDDVCRFIKSDPDLQATPVIMLVGANAASQWGRAVRAGADDVLAKPITRVELNQTVRRFMGGARRSGLPRVPLDSAVQLQLDSRTHQGRVRNLSRGGVFVETECELSDGSEIGLQFVLPGSTTQFNPTARVVWKQKEASKQSVAGIGMRFVDISGDLVRKLEDYVFDRVLSPHMAGAGATL
ncbi:MAG: response regulator [Deltaproteobacteria bacterium]|nr:response regulator [Deltaproteobacteria bacterium]